MPTEKGIYVLDTDASLVAISGILHQEQEWNGRKFLRPIAYGSKVLSDTEMKYEAANVRSGHIRGEVPRTLRECSL